MKHASRAFTLLEMVIAISIFAVIAAICYSALNNFLDARAHINEENEKIRQLQRVFVLLEQDLRYAVNRPVRNEYGDLEPAFLAATDDTLAEGERLRLTTLRPAPTAAGGHQLTRVAWRLADGELFRVTWRVLDRDIDSPEYRRRLIGDVENIELSFASYDGEGGLVSSDVWAGEQMLPAGVAVTVFLKDRPAYQRVFQLAGGA